MIQIVADDKIPFLKGALEGVAKVIYIPGANISRSDLTDSDVLITRTRTQCDQNLLEGTNVRFIASATIGFDHIDIDYCKSRGIEWTNAPGCNSSSVQQYIISTLLYLANLRQLNLTKLTLGIVGIGNVGSKVAIAARAMGMKVLKNDPPRQRKEGSAEFVELDEILKKADILSLHVPVNKGGIDNTYQLVNSSFIQRMKNGAVLINTSRGEIVDERALLQGIKSDKLSDVVLDVFQKEPRINLELLESITLGTPHIAGYSLDGKANGTSMSVRAISQFFNLGFDRWVPNIIPGPENKELFADSSSGNSQELIWKIFQQSYDVTKDNVRLKNNPKDFEKLRGDYPFRREPNAYSVRLFQGSNEIRNQLEIMGFSVLADYCA